MINTLGRPAAHCEVRVSVILAASVSGASIRCDRGACWDGLRQPTRACSGCRTAGRQGPESYTHDGFSDAVKARNN